MDNVKSTSFRIGGMTCVNCRDRIERRLQSTVGVEDASVDFNTGTAAVTYNASVITFGEIRAVIEQMDYRVMDGTARIPVPEIAGTLIIILSLYVLLRGLGIGALSSAFPLAEAGMGYGMLFVIGLVTSVHCVAMCGGINLSQCIRSGPAGGGGGGEVTAAEKGRMALLPSIFYNAGRVISYTTVGIIVGALGSVITLSGRFQGAIQLAAGTFMVIMGINMLGLFPALRRFTPRLPKIFAGKIDEQRAGSRNPLFIGLLNGLMPCGPLQAMQLYALSTGSPIAGGFSMFLFSLGTVPLMFGLGALSSVLGSTAKGPAFRRRVMRAGAILVTVMGMTMFTYGFNLGGFSDRFRSGLDFAGKTLAAINPFASNMGRTVNGSAAPGERAGEQNEKYRRIQVA